MSADLISKLLEKKNGTASDSPPNGHSTPTVISEASEIADSQLENALWAIRRGFKVFPCKKASKDPNGFLVPHGCKDATIDEAQVRKWWSEWQHGNVGILGGVIVDCDTGINSLAEAEAWREKVGLPPTLAVRTGRRSSYGIQYHYTGQTNTCPYECQGVSGEVRSGNTYGLGPGSIHPQTGERYEIEIDLPRAAYPSDCQVERAKKKAVNRLSKNPVTLKAGEKIKASFRQYWLVSQCGRLRCAGLNGDPLFAALCALRDQYCEKPEEKTDDMLRQICESGEANYGIHAPEPEEIRAAKKLEMRAAIKLTAGDFPDATDAAEKELVRHAERLKLFQRAGQLVEIIRLKAHDAEKKAEDKRLTRPTGTLMLEPLSFARLRETLASLINFTKYNEKKKDWVRTDCPTIIVSTYFGRKGNWNLPVLVGPVAAPLMRLDGTLLTEPGYDEKTGLYLESECDWLPVPENPTLADAQAALKKLYAPFAEFPWDERAAEEEKSIDFGVVASAIVSAIQRRAIGACPIHGFSAPAPRSGKSLLSEAAAIIATGKPAPASACSSDKEEFRKALTAILIEGQLVVNLDNIEQPLESPELCKIITQDEYGDRLLGESKTLCLPTNVLFTATGNSLTFRGDLAQRALLCKIDADREDPEQRTFAITNFKKYVLERRAELVCAALTILRAFFIAKEPKFEKPLPAWGGFEEWSEFVRAPVVWAGCGDPFDTRKRVVSGDPELEVAKQAYTGLFAEFENEQFTAHRAIKKANEGIGVGFATNEKLHDALSAVAGVKGEIEANRFGWWLRKWRDRYAGGMRLVRANDDSATPAYWRIERGKK